MTPRRSSWSTVFSRRATRRCGSGWRARRRATRSSPRSSPGTSSPTSRGRFRPPCGRCSPPASTRCRRSNGASCATPRWWVARSGPRRSSPIWNSGPRCASSRRAGSWSRVRPARCPATRSSRSSTGSRARSRTTRSRAPTAAARTPRWRAGSRRASATGARSSSSCWPTTTRPRRAPPTPRWRGRRNRPSARRFAPRRCARSSTPAMPPAGGWRSIRPPGSRTARSHSRSPTPSGSWRSS